MSRIGKKPVALPGGVSATSDSGSLTVKGPKGTLSMALLDDLVRCDVGDGAINVQPLTDSQRARAAWGMQRTMVQNLVTGVTEGFTKVLEITGVGYRAGRVGNRLTLQVGFSHPIEVAPPPGLSFEVETPTRFHIIGADKQVVGDLAARVRKIRPPEPYLGKGIRYSDERIRRKAGKAGKVGAKK